MEYSFRDSRKKRRFDKRVNKLIDFHWKYRTLTILIIGALVATEIVKSVPVSQLIIKIQAFGYISSFFLGMLFAYGFTTIPAIAGFIVLGSRLNFLIISAIGALGATLRDLITFKVIKDRLLHELHLASKELKIKLSVKKFLNKHKFLKRIAPLIAVIIIILPLPTRTTTILFTSVFAVSRYNTKKFLMWAYALNFISIMLITYTGKLFFV